MKAPRPAQAQMCAPGWTTSTRWFVEGPDHAAGRQTGAQRPAMTMDTRSVAAGCWYAVLEYYLTPDKQGRSVSDKLDRQLLFRAKPV